MRWVHFFKASDHQIEDVGQGGQHHVKRALAEIAKADQKVTIPVAPVESSKILVQSVGALVLTGVIT